MMDKKKKTPWGVKSIPYTNITIHRGTHRTVILIPFLGIVIKLPRFWTKGTIEQARWYRKKGQGLIEILNHPIEEEFSINGAL